MDRRPIELRSKTYTHLLERASIFFGVNIKPIRIPIELPWNSYRIPIELFLSSHRGPIEFLSHSDRNPKDLLGGRP